jgi:two-component system, chemotaxis family, response regulator Rcp1
MEPINILLVEDNRGDIRLTEEALIDSKVKNNLEVAMNGEEALRKLRQEGYRPDVIFLDLNMPRVSGREVLIEIKSDPGLKEIPVVILTTSQNEEDVLQSYENYCNCYISKPLDFDQFFKLVQSIDDFWFSIVKLPK